jgi:hypothetical protein
MGYDVHIVRTEHWLDAKQNPIRKEEVDTLIRNDGEVSWSQADYVDKKDENGLVNRCYAIIWKNTPCFLYDQAEIRCSNPRKEMIIKMVQIAKTFTAKVIGDDDEVYEVKKNIFGILSLIQKKP